ncbi:MAG: FAD-dependent oxidoreductase [Deltaproteobacteria bacterium]|nr:FAD-dependent oxidoreductase [Deltaproteobacteria bacterium]
MRIVIVGNGVAGMEAALGVRAREPRWSITIVSEESDHFFSRTALMYVLAGQMSHRDIEPLERDLYARARFDRVRARATGVDVNARVVELAGDTIPYDRLLVASGSRPRSAAWKGAHLRGVGHFVTLQDLEWLEHEVHGGPSCGGRPPRPDAHETPIAHGSPYRRRQVAAEARRRTARSALVIGGGLIGIEAVESLLAAGLTVHLWVRDEWFWPLAIDRREGAWIAEALRSHGVEVRYGDEVEELLGGDDGNVRGARSTQGAEIAVDVVVIAIGVVPNTEWLAASAIERDRGGGILVDAGLRTSAPDVLAAGDCASVPWPGGGHRPEQLWYTARDQGRVAARRLLGDEATYARGIFYNSAKLVDIEYTAVGQLASGRDGAADWLFEERGRVRSSTRIAVRNGHVAGFSLLGRRWDHSVLGRWIAERRSLAWVLDHLTEAGWDSELVPPLVVPPELRVTR